MDEKNTLNGVEDTLYIPLIARIYASMRFSDFFYDKRAILLKQYIPENNIEKNSIEYFYMASVCRQKTIDKKIIEFLSNNEKSNVVFLGCGLETAYNRINNSKDNFYQVDLPNVIDIRKKVLPEGKNEKLIKGDLFNLEWVKEIDVSLPTLIVASGVFQYFEKNKIIELIKNMKNLISKAELVFDATNSKGLKLANKYVKRTGNTNAQMHFSVDNPSEFAHITGTDLVSVSGFFSDALENCKRLKLKTKIYMYFADKLHRTLIVHLKLN